MLVFPSGGAKSFYQILMESMTTKECKNTLHAEFRDDNQAAWQRGGGYGSREYEWNSPPSFQYCRLLWLFFPLWREVLPLLTQESTSKARGAFYRGLFFLRTQRSSPDEMK